jgi:hypothetical protein
MGKVPAVVAAVAVALCAFLGYRVFRLEQRVDALNAQVGAARTVVGGPGKPHPASDHEHRLRMLEGETQALQDDLQSLEEATVHDEVAPNSVEADRRILSVVTREQERIRDRQLEFHRARWLEWRQGALDNFAQKTGLSPEQTDQLHRLLAEEVDALVALLRRPDVGENPERAANDWLDRLELTDTGAHQILDATQSGAWDAARAVERQVFWPWLPQD